MKSILLLFFSIYGVTCYTDTITMKQQGSAGAASGEMMMQRITLPVSTVSSLFWNSASSRLLYTDQLDGKYMRWSYDSGKVQETEIADFTDKQFMFLIPVKGQSQVYLAAVDGTLVRVTVQSGTPQVSQPIFKLDDISSSITRGHCDSQGRLFFGTYTNAGEGQLYKLEDGEAQVMATFPTSVDDCSWSMDYKTFYCIARGGTVIVKYMYDLNKGTIDKGTSIFNATDFSHFGTRMTAMEVDAGGNMWITLRSSGMLLHVNPNSRNILQVAKLPTTAPTCITFGGYKQKNLLVGSRKTGAQYDFERGSVYILTGLSTAGVGDNGVAIPVS